MAAKDDSTNKIISPLCIKWRTFLHNDWTENSKLYNERNIVKSMLSIDINLKILGNCRTINYYPEAISNIHKFVYNTGENRICKPSIRAEQYDCYPRILFAIVEAYILLWCIDRNYYRIPTYLDDCVDSLSERKLKAFYKCTTHTMSICYKIIKADQRLLEYKNATGKTIIDIVKHGIKKSDEFSYSQICEFFRNIEDLI